MQKAVLGARIVLGLIFFVFGLNYFGKFLPLPELSEPAGAFMGALAASGYMFPLVKITEIVGGPPASVTTPEAATASPPVDSPRRPPTNPSPCSRLWRW